MNRQQFNSINNVGKVLTFQKSGSTSSFDPQISFNSGSRRVSWKLNNGSETIQIAGNFITYTGFTSDNAIRNIEMRGANFKDITTFSLANDNIYGNLDLTGIPNLGGSFYVNTNQGLTGITHSPSSELFNNYWAFTCNLIGNLDLTPLSNMGGTFIVSTNPNLTGITHSPSSNAFNNYGASNCNLIGNLDLSMLTGLGGSFGVGGNPNLTGITHGPSTEVFANYSASFNGLLGNLDLSMFPNLGGSIQILLNPGLTGITHTATTQNITSYQVNSNNLNGVLDLTPLQNLPSNSSASTSSIRVDSNPSLTNVLLPTNNGYLKNVTNTEFGGALVFYSCSFDYLDFRPYSGVTFLSGVTQGNPRISLRDNNMLASDINHILVDFSGNATYNPTGWSNINLNIGGTNADPDSSSGGYDGLAAVAFLTGSPYNWTITY